MPLFPAPPSSRPPIEVRRRPHGDVEPINSRLPGVEDIHEGHPDWSEWAEFISLALSQRDPEDLRGVGPLALYDSDGVVTVPRWYVDQYLARVVSA